MMAAPEVFEYSGDGVEQHVESVEGELAGCALGRELRERGAAGGRGVEVDDDLEEEGAGAGLYADGAVVDFGRGDAVGVVGRDLKELVVGGVEEAEAVGREVGGGRRGRRHWDAADG